MHRLRTGLLGGGAVAAVGAIGVGLFGILSTPPPPERRTDARPVMGGGSIGPPATPFVWSGVTRPPTVPAAAADLADDEPVVGIIVSGRPRAYRVQALARMTGHVVNDVLAGSAVTVTYCDRTGCTRVFTGDGPEPLPVMTGGYEDGLLLRLGDRFYRQVDGRPTDDPEAAALPFAQLEFRQVSWKEWRAAHPNTDVYVADPRPAPPASAGRLSRPPGP